MAITNTWSKADSVGRGYTLKLTVTETSVDVANNSSTLSWNLSLVSTSYNYRQFNTGFTVSIGGVTVASQTRDWNHQTSMGFNSTLVLSSGSRSFAHNADGTKTVACSASLDISSDYPGPGAISIAGGNLVLTSIARESTISLNKTSLVAGEAVTWTVNKQNQSYTSTVTWAYGSKSGTIQTKSATASGTFTPDPSVLYSAGTSGTLTFSVTTWNGSTQVGGAKTASLTLSVKGPSTITATDANITAVSQLTVTRNHSTYTHSIYFERGSVHGYVTASGGVASSETRLTATSIGFTLPSSFYATIPNDKTGTVKLTVKTYYGSSGGQIGSAQTRNFTATAAESLCAPTIGTHTVVDINSATTALTGDSSKMVRGVSTARCTIAATAKNSATISKLIVNGSTVSSYKDIAQYNQANVIFEAVDSRGYSTKFTVTPTVIAYVLLTNYSKVIRPQPTDGSMRIQIRGDYWSGSFGSSSNSLTVKYRYREVGGSWNAYTTVTPTVSGGKYSKDVDFPNGFDYQKSYEVEVYAADRLNTIAPALTLMRGQPIADWGKDDFAIHGALEVYGKVDSKNGFVAKVTKGILADALACAGYNATYFFVGNGSDYTDNDLPNSNYAYGSFIVTRRYSTKIQVTAIPEDTSAYPIATNTWDSTNGWYGWRFEGANKPVSVTNSASVSNGSWTTICSASLDVGIYIVTASLHFPSNGTGNRELEIGGSGYATNNQRVNKSAVQGDYTILTHTLVVNVTTAKTVSVKAYQSSGSTLTANGYLAYTRIR